MSNDPAGESKAQAVALVQLVVDQNGGKLSHAQIAAVIQAVGEDIDAGADKATVDEKRLAKVETQTRVLSEAVMTMTETAASLAPAVRAVKDEM